MSMIEPGPAAPPPPPPAGPRTWLRPAWFAAGLILGLAVLSWLGRETARTDYHPDFVRFNPPISPEGNYYPSIDEMCAIVRARCRPDQILVIIGGNSILLGVWQPVTDLWTAHLQERLGDRYAVVNLAFRGSSPPDCGAVVAEVLRHEFRRQIYIADEAPITGEQAYGSEPYRFAFWQAYFGGRLLASPIRDQRVREYLARPDKWTEMMEVGIREEADRLFHFHDFWNRVGYDYLFTVPAPYSMSPPKLFWPRRDFGDHEPDATQPAEIAGRYPEAYKAVEQKIISDGPKLAYVPAPGGRWALLPGYRADLLRTFGEAFPDALKARTLLLIPRSSPHYTVLLKPDETSRLNQAYADTVELWKAAGYEAMEFGGGYTEDDYGDRSHLSKLGGRKLAADVAPVVEAMAARLHYLP
jgi:hypothetical protein